MRNGRIIPQFDDVVVGVAQSIQEGFDAAVADTVQQSLLIDNVLD